MPKRRPTTKLAKTFITTQQGYDVNTVNAFGVRDLTRGAEEFTNFATHGDFPDLVLAREIWVEERLFERERLFSLADALVRLKSLERGASEDAANDDGLDAERALRAKLSGLKYRDGKPHKRVPDSIYAERYVTLPDPKSPVTVWLVDGNLVRTYYKTDYTEGGHGYVYRWVPKGEIWVEHHLSKVEIPFIVAHEYLELRLMRDEGLEYDRAHAICSKVEFALRESDEVKEFLTTEDRKLATRDLPRLSSDELFAFVVKHYRHK
jgi:hypothetical protein